MTSSIEILEQTLYRTSQSKLDSRHNLELLDDKRRFTNLFLGTFVIFSGFLCWLLIFRLKWRTISPFSHQPLVFEDSLFAFIVIEIVVLTSQLLFIRRFPYLSSPFSTLVLSVSSSLSGLGFWLLPYFTIVYPVACLCFSIVFILVVMAAVFLKQSSSDACSTYGSINFATTLVVGFISLIFYLFAAYGFPLLSGVLGSADSASTDHNNEKIYWAFSTDWRNHSIDDKLVDLQFISSLESNDLGIEEPRIIISLLPDDVSASYSHSTNIIKLDLAYCLKNDSHNVINAIEHELCHAYQYELMANPSASRSSRIEISDSDLAQIERELGSAYVSSADERYPFQICEIKANEFADSATEDLFNIAKNWSVSNNIS